MKTFSDIQKNLATDTKALNNIIVESLQSDVALINQISQYIIHSGGKRLRPLLLLLTAKALNYQGKHQHTLAAVIEFIHTATLLHDDVVDESATRRGHKTANEKWGNAASILTGDFLYSRAFEMMVSVNEMVVMSILSKATNIIAQGEVMQLLNCKNPDLTVAEYFVVIERKTACLFQAATQLGAVIAKANKDQEQAMADYGLHLGNAFQIIDDILDYQSDAKTMGKEVGDDLAEGKTTLPMIYALKHANPKDKTLLTQAINEADNSNIEQIIAILTKLKAFDYAFKAAEICTKNAKNCLEILPNSDAKTALILLADLSLKRQS